MISALKKNSVLIDKEVMNDQENIRCRSILSYSCLQGSFMHVDRRDFTGMHYEVPFFVGWALLLFTV